MAAKLKKGDKVVVLTGKDKGKEGEILQVMPKDGKAVVQGVNIAIRHQRQTQASQGGRVPTEMPIQLSNLSFVDKNGKASRVGFKMDGDKKVRFAKTTGDVIDG
ncbi:MAG: 50S ribosomal protein L24 [Pseudomonadota bacterium]